MLDRAVEHLAQAGHSLLLELPEELVRVPLYEVEYMEVRGNYVTVHTAAEAYRVKKTLSAMEQELDDRFFRIGRSYILNLGKVRKVTKREVQLFSGSRLPLPRGMYEPLNRAIIQKL